MQLAYLALRVGDHITFGRLCGHYESKSNPLNFPSAYSHDQ